MWLLCDIRELTHVLLMSVYVGHTQCLSPEDEPYIALMFRCLQQRACFWFCILWTAAPCVFHSVIRKR